MASAGPSNRLGNNGGRSYNFLAQPVSIDCAFTVDNSAAAGVTGLVGAGVQAVYMYSSAPSSSNPLTDATASAGVALVQLKNNYFKYGGFAGSISPPVTGSNLAINGSALTAGTPYVITAVGAGSAGTQTIVCTADTAGSLASKYFSIFDAYGNVFVIWFQVSGVGGAPVGVYGTPVPVSITANDANTVVATALNTVLNAITANTALNPSAPAVASFSSTRSSATLTVVNVVNQPFSGGAIDGTSPLGTGFTFAVTKDQTNTMNWQAVGLPKGIIPVVNASFVATASGYSSRGGSTGTVKAVSVSGVAAMDIVGDVNQSLNPGPMGGSPNVGGWILVRFLGASVSGVFTGSALASHTHNFTVIGGQAASTTNDIANYAGPLLGKEQATNATYLGANSATNGGVVAASAGTPAGTIAATSTQALVAPAAGSVVRFNFIFESKAIIIVGE